MTNDKMTPNSQEVKNSQKLSPTKTVWGLTKEEIEFCAYFVEFLSVISLITHLVYFFIALRYWMNERNSEMHFIIASLLFILSFISMVFGFYGINYENKMVLMVFSIIGFFSFFVNLWVAVAYNLLMIGAIIVMVILVLQMVLSLMLIHCLVVHKEIFKKIVDNWYETSQSSGMADIPIEVFGSSLDINKKQKKLKNDKEVNESQPK